MKKVVYKDLVRSKVQSGEWEVEPAMVGEFAVTRPTPTQAENDSLTADPPVLPMIKIWDLAPVDPQSFDPFEPPGRPVSPPTNIGPPVVSIITNLAVGSQLACSQGTWTGATTYARQWMRGANQIAGATGLTYNLVAADVGNMLSCVVTATASDGQSSTAQASNSVGPAVPANTVAPAVTGTTIVGSALACSNGTWSPNTGLTYVKQWLSGGASIPGATGNNYTLQGPDVGAMISCAVTVTQTASGAVSSPALSNAVGPITATADDPDGGESVQPTRQPQARRR